MTQFCIKRVGPHAALQNETPCAVSIWQAASYKTQMQNSLNAGELEVSRRRLPSAGAKSCDRIERNLYQM